MTGLYITKINIHMKKMQTIQISRNNSVKSQNIVIFEKNFKYLHSFANHFDMKKHIIM